jgi:hypothetical protein
MSELIRVPLDGGGSILVEDTRPETSGPVRAGRAGEAIRDATGSLQAALVPVRRAAQAVLDELRKAGPDEVTVELGVSLTAEAGAIITKTEAAANLTVTVTWKREAAHGESQSPSADPPADV